jgi:periplasmic protein TonB
MLRKIMPAFLFFTVITSAAGAQIDSTKNEVEDAEDRTFDKVEIEATFPGGDQAWIKYLQRTLNAATPVDNGAPAGTYTVIVQFVVTKDGSISDVKALTNHGYGMEKEVIRVIKMGPKWIPAFQEGRQVKAYRKQPVTFAVIDEGKKKKRKNKD